MTPAFFIPGRLRKATLSYISPVFPGASIRVFALGLLFLAFTSNALAGQVTLAWDANTNPELGGYKLYYGQTSRNYTGSVDVGNQTIYSLTGLTAGQTYYFAVTAYDNLGLNESAFSSEVQATIPISTAAPVANFTASPTTGAASLNVAFTNTSTGSVTAWNWNFGDGVTSAVQNPSHNYSASGTYSVSLTVTGPGGSNSVTKTNYIAVAAPAPVANFTASPTSGTAALNVAFTDTSTGSITARSWNFGDGMTSAVQNPSHTYSASGTYSVSLTVTGPGGSNSVTKTNYIAVTPPAPVAGATTTYEDAEDGKIRGWGIFDKSPAGAKITNIFDPDRGNRVIQLTGSGTQNGYRLRKPASTKWHNSSQFVVEWSMRYSQDFIVYLDVQTNAGHRYLYYTPENHYRFGSGDVYHGLGTAAIDGQWHTFVRDLQADLADAQPGVTILEVNSFLIRGTGRLDDIKLRTDSITTYEDADDITISGWSIYDDPPGGATIGNVYDNDRNTRVIQLTGSGTQTSYSLTNSNGTGWHNASQFVVEWSTNYSDDFIVYLDVETTAGHRYLYYTPENQDGLGSGEYVHHGLGTAVMDGQWHTVVRDLQADLAEAQPGVTILEVNGVLIRGSGRVDDIKLHSP